MAKLSPVLNDQQLDLQGNLLSGGKIFSYIAGSTAPTATYTTAAGDVAQSNPIILNAMGRSDDPIWLMEGISYKLRLFDANDNFLIEYDNITGVGDQDVIQYDEWVNTNLIPTYINGNEFSVDGDQTSLFQNKRRLKLSISSGTIYATIASAVYSAVTTVTLVMDSTILDAGLSSVQVAVLSSDNPSTPSVIEDYRATLVASETDTPIWISTAKVQDWTGTPEITNLPPAPKAGATREVFPAAGTKFVNNANLEVQNGSDFVVAAGDMVFIFAKTTTVFQIIPIRAINGDPQIFPVEASVATNALTVNLDPTLIEFRSATLTDGKPVVRRVNSQLSLVVPSGATLGTVNATRTILYLIAIDNAGTVELAIVNPSGGMNLDESGLISTTAISGAANSARVIYSENARTNVAYRIVGYIDITEAVAGTWATGPAKVQGVGGQVLNGGIAQTRVNQTANRVIGTTYTNTSGRVRYLNIVMNIGAGQGATLSIGGLNSSVVGNNSATLTVMNLTGIVLPGETYTVTATGSSINIWVET